MEVWKDIEGYEGLYQVSSCGEVRSLDKIINLPNGVTYIKRGMTRRKNPDKYGYYTITLRKAGVPLTYKIHRLVAKAFIENPNCYPQVNHKDENKKNNCVENLEWCDAKYNCSYGTRGERISKKTKGKIVSEESRRKMSEAKKRNRSRPDCQKAQ